MPGHDLTFALSLRAALPRSAGSAAIAPHTPLWHVRRVLKTSAADWWEDGVPPSRGRRAVRVLARAMCTAAGGVQRHQATYLPG